MARERDHAKEYARRREIERKRAIEERRAFNLANARGKGGLKATVKPPGKPPKRSSAAPAPSAPRKGGRALKPLSELSPAQRRRYENYARKHGIPLADLDKSRTKARGHKADEGKARKLSAAREEATGELSKGHRNLVRAHFNREIAPRNRGKDLDALWREFLANMTRIGWEGFKNFVKFRQEQLIDTRPARKRSGERYDLSDMEGFATDLGLDDWIWLWYN